MRHRAQLGASLPLGIVNVKNLLSLSAHVNLWQSNLLRITK